MAPTSCQSKPAQPQDASESAQFRPNSPWDADLGVFSAKFCPTWADISQPSKDLPSRTSKDQNMDGSRNDDKYADGPCVA